MQERQINTLENYSDDKVQKIVIQKSEDINWNEWDRFQNDLNYIFVPSGGRFDDIHIAARVLYGMLLDKLRYDGEPDDSGIKKLNYTLTEMSADMGYHRGHIQRLLKELQEHNLILRKSFGPQKPVDVYVNMPSMVH